MGIQVPLQPIIHWDKGLISDFWQGKAEDNEEFNTVEILDAKYEVPDLINVAQTQTCLSPKENMDHKELFLDYQDLFQARPGK